MKTSWSIIGDLARAAAIPPLRLKSATPRVRKLTEAEHIELLLLIMSRKVWERESLR